MVVLPIKALDVNFVLSGGLGWNNSAMASLWWFIQLDAHVCFPACTHVISNVEGEEILVHVWLDQEDIFMDVQGVS